MQNPLKTIVCAMTVCLLFLSVKAQVFAAGPHYDLGVFAFEEGDYANAENHLKKALEIDPEDARGAHFLGKTYIKMERFNEASAYLNDAWRKDPELPDLKFDRAFVSFKLADYAAAANLFRSIADEYPSDAAAAYHAGVSLFKLGRYKEAPAYLIQAAEKSRTVKDIGYFYAGICYHKTGQSENALRMFTYVKTSAQSAELKENAEKWIKEIEKSKKAAQPYSLFLKTGIQYDSNVNLGPLDGDTVSEEDDIVSLLFFSGKYDAIDNGVFVLGAGYSHYQTFHADLSEYDMAGIVGSIYGKYRFYPFVAGMTYYPAYYRLDNNGFLMRHQIRPELTCEAGDRVLLRLTFDHFINNHIEDDGRSGHANAGETELLYALEENKGHVFMSGGLEDNQASDPDYDYELIRAKLGFSCNLPGKLTLRVSGQVSDKDYDNTDTTFLVKRKDTQYKAGAALSRPLVYDWLMVSGEFELIQNDSNIDAFEYREVLTTVSLSALY